MAPEPDSRPINDCRPVDNRVRRLGYRPQLDGIRAIAIALVALYHTSGFLGDNFAPGGFLGVDIFFVLSGFLITTLLLERRTSESHPIRTFYLRRILRLMPAVIVLLLANLLYALVHGGVDRALRSFVVVLSYLTNWALLAGVSFSPYLAHLWTLAVEEQFYIVWPILMFAILRVWPSRRKLALITLSLAIASAAWRAALYLSGTPWLLLYFRTDARADALAIGALLAIAPRERLTRFVKSRAPGVLGSVALALLLAAAAALPLSSGILYLGGFTLAALTTAVLIATVLDSDSALSKLLSTRPLVVLGRLSYSIYLWHYGIFTVIAAHTVTWATVPRIAVAWGTTLVIAIASYRFVELPPLSLKRRLGRESRTRPARAGTPVSETGTVADAGRADSRRVETDV